MELNFKSFGQGTPVIILHGLFGNLDNWQTFAKQLAEHFLVYIVDQRNHGRSPHTDEMNYQAAAEDLRNFMEDQWIYRAHLIGHSMGGKTAMQFAFDYPDMLDRLVVVDITPRVNPDRQGDLIEAMLALDPSQLTSRKEAEEQLIDKIPDFGVRAFLLKNLTRNKTGGYRWKMNLPVLHQALPNILAAVEGEPFTGPTLFVRGGQSDYIANQDWPEISRLFPEASLATIPDAGHWVHADAPQSLLEHIIPFLGVS